MHGPFLESDVEAVILLAVCVYVRGESRLSFRLFRLLNCFNRFLLCVILSDRARLFDSYPVNGPMIRLYTSVQQKLFLIVFWIQNNLFVYYQQQSPWFSFRPTSRQYCDLARLMSALFANV